MKKLLLMCTVAAWVFCLYAENKPNASVHLRVTNRLPIRPQDGCSGVFTVTNIGKEAFQVFTGNGRSDWTMRFYRESDDPQQQDDKEKRHEKQREARERRDVVNLYHIAIEKYPEDIKTLRPMESTFWECDNIYFTLSLSSWSNIYKAEMYLGDDTWVPVTISPPIGYIRHVDLSESDKDNVFVFAQEGTNQFLYLKTEGEFKRVGEMALKSTPKKVDKENAVTFVSPDGKLKKLTREQAAEIIREREQQNQ